MVTRLIIALGAALIAYVAWQLRQRKARRRLREIDEGMRCIACDRVDLTRKDGFARCNACGHTVSLAGLQAVVLSADDIKNITRPDNSRL